MLNRAMYDTIVDDELKDCIAMDKLVKNSCNMMNGMTLKKLVENK